MVKPPRTMQPEAVNLEKAGRAAGKAFQDDSFRNYMARKIDLQRKQVGALPPPPPPPPAKIKQLTNVSFAVDVEDNQGKTTQRKAKRKYETLGMASILKRLERRHGKATKTLSSDDQNGIKVSKHHDTSDTTRVSSFLTQQPSGDTNQLPELEEDVEPLVTRIETEEASSGALSPSREIPALFSLHNRPDLFFLGVVVVINGYTQPDAESLQRLLQKHGGDVEKYETSRITHIIAEHLSTAKAKIYAKQRKPIPVVFPSWIVDSIKAQRQLPHAPYLIPEVRDLQQQPSVATFFQKLAKTKSLHDTPPLGGEDERDETTVSSKNVTQQYNDDEKSSGSRCKDARETTFLLDDDKGNSSTRSVLSSIQGKEEIGREIQNPYLRITTKELKSEKVPLESSTIAGPSRTTETLFQRIDPVVNVDLKRRPEPGGPVEQGKTDDKYINGQVRTVGTDPNFLETFFSASRLSFIGSFRQRASGNSAAPSSPQRGNRPSLRYVLHVDMDSFFAAVVLRNFPQFKDLPVAICHQGKAGPNGAALAKKDSTSECATCNYQAREYGITKGMFLGQARVLCPQLIVLPYDFEGYEEVSEQVSSICQNYATEHHGAVEAVSCDESYMEVFVKESFEVEKLAQDIRREIYEETSCTATIGIASNKLLAKLATDRVKPNGWYMASGHVDLLKDLRLKDLHGIGYRSESKLAERGFLTVQDVWDRVDSAEEELQTILGKQLGSKIYNFCHGIDDRPIQAADRKTIGAECNYGVRFDGPYGVDYLIDGLCREVQKRMEHIGVTGAKVTLKVKQRKQGAKPPPKFLGHGSCHNLSKSRDISRPSRDSKTMASLCLKMFEELNVDKDDVRGMGVIMSKLLVGGKEPCGGIQSYFLPREQVSHEVHADISCVDKCKSSVEDLDQNESDQLAAELNKHEIVIGDMGVSVADDEEEAKIFCLSQDDEDEQERGHEVICLSQQSALSDEIGESCRKRQRHSLDSLEKIGFETKGPVKRKSLDSVGVDLDDYSCTKERLSIDAADFPATGAVDTRFDEVSVYSRGRRSIDSLDDIALPSSSQIHMSQVAALPSPMRRAIHAKLKREEITMHPHEPNFPVKASDPPTALPPPRYRQTDVKRMMCLAAVKAGQGGQGKSSDISLTQLDRLPMEVQLQVVNNDALSLGAHSPAKKTTHKSSSNFRASTKSSSSAGLSKGKNQTKKPRTLHPTMKRPCAEEAQEGAPKSFQKLDYVPMMGEQEFFRENIFPFSNFLDQNIPNDKNLELVHDFVSQFVTDYSLYEVSLLFRSMNQRSDAWNQDGILDGIFFNLKEKFRQETGDELDFGQIQ